jgi:beta-galactosidase/beta-glucuronidase
MRAPPRPEYPRPRLVRPAWRNLNGSWAFAFDDADRGLAEGWHAGPRLDRQIVVPFSFEAPLSGIGVVEPHPIVWYCREFAVPDAWRGRRLRLHVGACDFATRIWVNGRAVGHHRGGYTPITCDVTAAARPGRNEVVIRAEDRLTWGQPRGKQIVGARPEGIDYDRVTGIWQTVWLEPVPDPCIEDVWPRWLAEEHLLGVRVETSAGAGEVEVALRDGEALVGRDRAAIGAHGGATVRLAVERPRRWSPDAPHLYDLVVRLRTDSGDDEVHSYAGLRTVAHDGRRLLLNGEPIELRGILDQGYFPGGWYTAAGDGDLRRDVELIRAMGFNLARKHQKAEDPRWLYWADRLGLLVWSEIGMGRAFGDALVADYTAEWLAAVRRDRGHPCVMAWVPFNESWGIDGVARDPRQQAFQRALFELTRSLDPTRPVIANDGWEYLCGDVWGLHCYVTDGAALAECLRLVLADPSTQLVPGRAAALPGAAPRGRPVLLTECGGVALRGSGEHWGYAQVDSADALLAAVRDVVGHVRALPEIGGFVWTQLTDVQQEANGLLRFDRTPKVPIEAIRAVIAP